MAKKNSPKTASSKPRLARVLRLRIGVSRPVSQMPTSNTEKALSKQNVKRNAAFELLETDTWEESFVLDLTTAKSIPRDEMIADQNLPGEDLKSKEKKYPCKVNILQDEEGNVELNLRIPKPPAA